MQTTCRDCHKPCDLPPQFNASWKYRCPACYQRKIAQQDALCKPAPRIAAAPPDVPPPILDALRVLCDFVAARQ